MLTRDQYVEKAERLMALATDCLHNASEEFGKRAGLMHLGMAQYEMQAAQVYATLATIAPVPSVAGSAPVPREHLHSSDSAIYSTNKRWMLRCRECGEYYQ